MKAILNFSLKPIVDEILESIRQVNTVPVQVKSKVYLGPVELRRYVRTLRKTRQTNVN